MRLAPLSLAAFLLAAASAPVSAQTYYDWMSPEIKDAWAQGYKGQGTTITVIDDFRSNYGYYGNLGDGRRLLRHGEWTFKEIGMLAPSASMKQDDFSTAQQVRLYSGLNVLNMSYGMYVCHIDRQSGVCCWLLEGQRISCCGIIDLQDISAGDLLEQERRPICRGGG